MTIVQPEDKNLLALAHWLTKRIHAIRSVRDEAGKPKSGVQSAGGSYVLVNSKSRFAATYSHCVLRSRSTDYTSPISLDCPWGGLWEGHHNNDPRQIMADPGYRDCFGA